MVLFSFFSALFCTLVGSMLEKSIFEHTSSYVISVLVIIFEMLRLLMLNIAVNSNHAVRMYFTVTS